MVTDTIFTGSAVADHGSLTGLEDDDHAQYLLVAGTRPMTGALDMGTHEINNVVDPGADQDAATKKYVDDNAGIPSYRIATGEALTIEDYEQLIIHDAYLIEGSGGLTVNGAGELVVIGGRINVYAGSGTFNSTTGVTMSIGATVDDTLYSVSIIPTTANPINVGEISVGSKAVSQFVVKNSGTDNTSTFDWIVALRT